MPSLRVNRISRGILIALSLIALLTVLSGYFQAPQRDEGTGAHIFQLTVLALFPTICIFLATADWKKPSRSVRALVLPATSLVLAFGALYYLEHYR